MANLSSSTGYTPLQTRIPLANNGTTNVQDFALYEAQQLTGFVYIDATTDKRAAVVVTVVRNGAGTYEVGATDIIGDDNSGLPIVSFSMSGSVLQATLVSYAGFVSAYIQFNLAAPLFGANYPLTVSTTNIVGRTDGVAQSAGYIGQVVTWASAPTNFTVPTSLSDWPNATIVLTPGIWLVTANLLIFCQTNSTSGSSVTVDSRITDSSNVTLNNQRKLFYVSNGTGADGVQNTSAFSTVVNVSTTTTYKIRVLRTEVNAAAGCAIYNDGSSQNSDFYAVRIA